MAHASGKYSKAISDRSGMEFPYKEMVKEWNGSLVHKSEFEAKHPQLERQKHAADAQSVKDGRPDRLEPITVFVGGAGFFEYENSMEPSTSKKQPLVVSSIGIVSVSVS
jgi:sulfur carrier protein ThiS